MHMQLAYLDTYAIQLPELRSFTHGQVSVAKKRIVFRIGTYFCLLFKPFSDVYKQVEKNSFDQFCYFLWNVGI